MTGGQEEDLIAAREERHAAVHDAARAVYEGSAGVGRSRRISS